MKRLLVVSSRLPVNIEKRRGEIILRPSVGGVATGLSSVVGAGACLWLGWAEIASARVSVAERAELAARLRAEQSAWPVFLSERDAAGFYLGFSNRTLWPLFHYFSRYAEFDRATWHAYERVNRQFRDAVLQVYEPGDTIWVHDYQLMLLPKMLREALPHASIGFFLHIPFPSYEIFRMLPWRRELIEGILGSDLVGLHTFDYVGHFLNSARSLLGIIERSGLLELPDRVVAVEAFPMGIDVERFAQLAEARATKRQAARMRPARDGTRTILSVDRLDYTKGIPERLEAFDSFLETHPEWRGRVRMLCIAVPSRTRVERYLRLKRQVDELVGRINGRWGTHDWVPVTYLYRSYPISHLAGFYAASDVCLVTPLRDGMNLIAKEWVASKGDGPGVLVLSEMAGAARELGEALIVNPYDCDAIVAALSEALEMPPEEQARRNSSMLARLRRYDVKRWAEDFLDQLEKTKMLQVAYDEHLLTPPQRDRLLADAKAADERVLVLDYDGTLVPFARKPSGAVPDADIMRLLQRLVDAPRTTVVVLSGRDRATLDEWLGELGAVLIAEHGAWIRLPGEEWATAGRLSTEWKDVVRPFLERAVDRTPGSFIEEKDFSLAWHYRASQTEQASVRVRELIELLVPVADALGLSLLEGNKVLEIKNLEVDKGRAAYRWMSGDGAFVLAAGDDHTDEDVFSAAPDSVWTLKIGRGRSRARSSLPTFYDLRALLGELAETIESEPAKPPKRARRRVEATRDAAPVPSPRREAPEKPLTQDASMTTPRT